MATLNELKNFRQTAVYPSGLGVLPVSFLDISLYAWKHDTPNNWDKIFTIDKVDSNNPQSFLRESLTYRVWEAFFYPLQIARDALDLTFSRLDPSQAIESELPILADMANVDPVSYNILPIALKRKYISVSRILAKHRGTPNMSDSFRFITGAPVQIEWHPSIPYRRVVRVLGGLSAAQTKTLIRRHFPANIEVELHYQQALPPMTAYDTTWDGSSDAGYQAENGVIYTATENPWDGGSETGLGYTESAAEIVEVI